MGDGRTQAWICNPVLIQRTQSLWRTLKSVLWALLGVQKSGNAQEDFGQPHPWHFVLLGVLVTVLFVLGLMMVVNWVAS